MEKEICSHNKLYVCANCLEVKDTIASVKEINEAIGANENLSCEVRLNNKGVFTFYGEQKDEIAKRYCEIIHEERERGKRLLLDDIISSIQKLA